MVFSAKISVRALQLEWRQGRAETASAAPSFLRGSPVSSEYLLLAPRFWCPAEGGWHLEPLVALSQNGLSQNFLLSLSLSLSLSLRIDVRTSSLWTRLRHHKTPHISDINKIRPVTDNPEPPPGSRSLSRFGRGSPAMHKKPQKGICPPTPRTQPQQNGSNNEKEAQLSFNNMLWEQDVIRVRAWMLCGNEPRGTGRH